MNNELLPFDLETALKNPERVVYRNGEKPLEWHWFKHAQWQIVSVTPQREIQINYENGVSHSYDEFDQYIGTKSSHDLMLLPLPEKRYWVNVYVVNGKPSFGAIYKSEEQAKARESEDSYLKTITFTI